MDGILQYIDRGITVLGDRYYLSSYAYHVPHVSLDWVIKANEVCANLLRPDITFYIDISVETSLERISKGRQTTDLFENRNRITTVKQNYEEAISAVTVKENIIRINGEQSEEAVFADILSYL